MDINDDVRRPIATPLEALDLLVDGALGPDDRRALLLRLDREPDGWRRCALAFLESQAWREALGVEPQTVASAISEAGRSPRRRRLDGLVPIALAACLAAFAFAIGRASSPTALETPVVTDKGREAPAPITSPEPSDALPTSPMVPDEGLIREVGYVELPSSDPMERPDVRLPVLAGPGLDERWLRSRPSFVPETLLRRWADRGYSVAHQRRLVSVQVDDDGRYLTIPVDEVLLRDERQPTY